jgi:hypothetical protein
MNSASGIGFGSSAVQNAQLGINRGMANLAQDAQTVAQGGPVTGALVDAQQQKLDVEASATALSIADLTGALPVARRAALPAALEPLQQREISSFLRRPDADPFDRHGIELLFVGGDALTHALYQALHLVLAA